MAEEIKLGVLIGFTGPIESLTGHMAAAAELAMDEATASGMLLDGSTVVAVRADSTCVDSAAATAAAERLITADRRQGDHRRRLLGRHRCRPAERRAPERHRDDLALGHLARTDHGRR